MRLSQIYHRTSRPCQLEADVFNASKAPDIAHIFTKIYNDAIKREMYDASSVVLYVSQSSSYHLIGYLPLTAFLNNKSVELLHRLIAEVALATGLHFVYTMHIN